METEWLVLGGRGYSREPGCCDGPFVSGGACILSVDKVVRG